MDSTRADLIRLLEAELDLIESGAGVPRAGHPGDARPIFDRSLVCINHWQVPGHEPGCHDDCILLDSVPPSHRDEKLPCHFIPLDREGDTVHTLEQSGDSELLQRKVAGWLRAEIARLKATPDTPLPPATY